MNEKGPMMDVIEQAKKQGWSHEVSGSGHHKLRPPNGGHPVITSASPGDSRVFKNFLAAMKRGGFKEHDEREELMAKRRVRGIIQTVRDYVGQYPFKVFSVDEMQLVIHARIPEASVDGIRNAIQRMFDSGELVRLERGQYRKAEPEEPAGNGKDQKPEPTEPPPAIIAISDVPPAEPKAPTVDTKSEVDQLLEDFLSIASRVEAVLRRHQRIERKNEELKKLLLERDD